MTSLFSTTNVRGEQFNISTDPLGQFNHLSDQQIIDLVGMLPSILINSGGDYFRDRAVAGYAMTSGGRPHKMEGGTIDPNGSYDYPEDPTLYPLMAIECPREGEVTFIYHYGMVAYEDETDTHIMVRMD